jgi:hypothetical protein
MERLVGLWRPWAISSSLPVAAKAGKTRSRANWALAFADSQTSTMTTSPDGVSATAWQIRPRRYLAVEVHHLGDLVVLGAGGGLADLEDRHGDPS